VVHARVIACRAAETWSPWEHLAVGTRSSSGQVSSMASMSHSGNCSQRDVLVLVAERGRRRRLSCGTTSPQPSAAASPIRSPLLDGDEEQSPACEELLDDGEKVSDRGGLVSSVTRRGSFTLGSLAGLGSMPTKSRTLKTSRYCGIEPTKPDDDVDDPPPSIALRDVTLVCSFEDMRRVARFVNEVVATIDSDDVKPLPGWHMHFQNLDPDWVEGEADLIVHWNAQE
jgi:hypothetical protein